VKVRALLAIVATAALLSAGARSAAAPELVPYRTLVATRAPIVSFAQDGEELAWVERPAGKRCRRILHLRSLRHGHETTARIGCGAYDLALAGTRALWKRPAGGTNLERDVDVMTLAAGERRAHTLERVDVEFDPPDCHDLARTCRPESEPGLAGGSGVLAYATPAGVRRVVHGVHGSLSRFPAAAGLTVANGLVLAFRSELRPGDGCGCASSPAWLPDGSIEYLSHIGLTSDLNGELTRISSDGSGRQRLTNDRRFRLTLDVSADGTKVAYGYVDLPTPAG